MINMLESKTVEVIDDPEPELEVDDKTGPKVVAELVSQYEEIFPRPIEVVELSIETIVDLSAELIMELVSSLTVMRVSFFLRSPDV